MNYYKVMLAICCSLYLHSPSIHAYSASHDEQQKVYVEQDAIEVTEDGIFIFLGDLIVLVDEVHHDKNGYFVYGLDSVLLDMPTDEEECF